MSNKEVEDKEVEAAFASALEARKNREPSREEKFFAGYYSALVEIINPALDEFTASPAVKLQFLLLEVSGDARNRALILKLGRDGVHRLEFSPDFARERVSIRKVTPYGVENLLPVDLTNLSRTYIFNLAAAFILDSTS